MGHAGDSLKRLKVDRVGHLSDQLMVGDAVPGFVPSSGALVDEIEAVDLVDDVAQAGVYRGPARDAVVLNQRIGKSARVEVVGNACRDRVGIVDPGRHLDVVVAIARR